jgi:alcohol dehydrogenase
MLDGILNYLQKQGCEVTVFDGIIPNPTFAVVEAGLKASLDNECDAVFAVGGGSAIDTAKVIAAASTDDRDLEQLAGIMKIKNPLLPFFVVPTTSGTGSEVTTAAVISNTETHQKTFFVDAKYIPIATALDPVLLKSLPPAMTAAVGMDALTHAIEAYTSKSRFDESDRDAEMAIRLLTEFLPVVYENGADEHAREMVSLASFLAGYAFTKSSLGMVHAISHQISAHYNTPHGLTNAVILPRVLRFNRKACEVRYAALETMLSKETPTKDKKILTDRFIARIDKLSETVGIPVNLDMIEDKDHNAIAKEALAEARSSYAVPRVMNRGQVRKILESISSGDRNIAFA